MNKNNIEYAKTDTFKKIIKYILEGFAVAIVARYLPEGKLNIKDISIIALSASCMFAILDMYSPSISDSVRKGAGLAIGANALGGLGIKNCNKLK